jgi:hypothetical protein
MKPAKPKRLHPVVSILMAVVLIGLGGAMGYFAFDGINRNVAPFPKKHGPLREVSKEDQPRAFYFAVGFYSVTSVLFSTLGILQIREAKLWVSERRTQDIGI